MTTPNELPTLDFPTSAVSAPPPAGDTQSQDADNLVYPAEAIEIGIGDGEDPFDATFLLAGTDSLGQGLALWIRLTPTTINDLTRQLDEVLSAQQQILGLEIHPEPSGGDNPAEDDDESEVGEGRVKRFFDPMGIRHLRERSPRSTVILGAAIATLVVLAFVLQWARG